MSRFLLIVVLTVGLILAGCAPPDSQTESAAKEQPSEKAAKNKRPPDAKPTRQEQPDPEPDANVADGKEAKPGAGSPPEPEPQPAFSGSAPKEILASQYRHVNAGDYGAAYDLFDDQSQRLVSSKQYSAYFASEAPYEIESSSFSSVEIQGKAASLDVDLTVSSSSGDEQYQVTQRLVRERGSWRVVMRDEQVASFAAAGVSSTSANAPASASPASGGSGGNYDATVTVSRVVDGDTVEISPAIDGVNDVRLIGIDTPETVDPGEEVEPYGPESSDFATEELTGQSVGLEFGVERTDQYDRLLAYVYVGEEMFNEILVEEGYAQAYPYEPDTEYEDRFATAQEEAKAPGLGIWGLSLDEQCLLANHSNGIGEGSPGCGSGTASPEPTSSAPPSSEDLDCSDFGSQAEAQATWTRTPATPTGWTRRATAKPAKPPRSEEARPRAPRQARQLLLPRAPRRPLPVAGCRPGAAT